jgi:hypothetical protein
MKMYENIQKNSFKWFKIKILNDLKRMFKKFDYGFWVKQEIRISLIKKIKWIKYDRLLSSRAIVKQLFSYCEVKVIIY